MDRTETRNPRSVGLDAMADDAILNIFLESQERAVAAVRDARDALARATRAIVSRIGEDGRLIYVGAGSSGLIAALDGMELAGTFGWPEERTTFLLAGGYTIAPGLAGSVEDDAERGLEDSSRLVCWISRIECLHLLSQAANASLDRFVWAADVRRGECAQA